MTARRVRAKYGAIKVQIDGITFDSKAEAARYGELKQLEADGHITELMLQPKFELAPSVKLAGSSRATPPLRYYADFSYRDHLGRLVVEDVKGLITEGYRIKRHLLKALHGIDIVEVRRK